MCPQHPTRGVLRQACLVHQTFVSPQPERKALLDNRGAWQCYIPDYHKRLKFNGAPDYLRRKL